jgi:ParB-like chromosome segregation protein Spo0J
MEYEYHEVANIFPMMGEPEFSELKADIAKNGLKLPIWLHEGKIVDGRNRYKACLEVGGNVERFQEWDKKGSLVEFAASLNLQRRNLSQSQKAMAAQACLPLLEAEAKARQKLAGESTHSNQHKNVQLVPLLAQAAEATSSEESPVKNNLRASQEAGKIMGVGKTLVVKAKAIAKASPEMAEAIKNGDITVSTAEKQLKDSGVLIFKKPTKPSSANVKPAPLETAMQFARIAKSQLERIRDDDKTRVDALNFIIGFATDLLNKNNKKAL